MKDLTHYFQSPPNTSHKENIDVLTLQDDNEEMFFRKSDKISTSKSKRSSKTSPLSSSSLKIENKSNSSTVSKVKLDESKKDDCQDISIIVQNNILTETKPQTKKCRIETASSNENIKNFKGKGKVCLSSNKASKRKSSSKNGTEQKTEKATGENLISDSTQKLSNKDENIQEKSSNEIKLDSPSEHHETTDKDNTMKTPPQLNDNANAFYILMSSRAWKSPHAEENKNGSELSSTDKKTKRSVAETPLKTAEMKENNKKRKKILEDMAEQKRIKKIKHNIPSEEIVNKNTNVRSKRVLIIPDSDSDAENGLLDTTVISKTDVKCNGKEKDVNTDHKIDKSVVLLEDIISKKNKLSKDENSSNISPMKLYNSQRKSPRKANYRLVIEDSEDSSLSEPEKCFKKEVKEIIHNDEEQEKNMKRKPKQKLNTGNNKKAMKRKSKFLIEDSDTESEEELIIDKSLKRTPRKLGTVSNKKTVQIKRKLMHNSSESENEKSVREKKKRNKLSRKKDKSIKVKLKPPLSFKKKGSGISITPIKDSPNETEKKKNKSVKEEENASDKIVSIQKENIEIVKVINSEKSTKLSPSKKKESNEVTGDYGSNSKCGTDIKSNINSQSSEQDGKKRNSLFSYFNKVTKSEVISKSEVIKVTAQIHSPPASPSTKHRSSRVASHNVNRKRQSCSNKVSDKEEQIIVLESSVTENLNNTSCPETQPRTPTTKRKEQKTPPSSGWRMRVRLKKSPPEPAVDEGDDDGEDSGDIFTPKKNWPTNKPSAQQIAAREVLKKAKTIFTQRSQNDRSPPVIQVKTTPGQHKSNEDESDEVIICSSPENKLDTAVKLAPLFIRAKPKPKLDPAVVEARKNFLKSGVPESVKKLVDLQRSMEEQCYFTFPSIAHVQQRDEKCIMWDLPLVNFLTNENITNTVYPSFTPLEEIKLGSFNICIDSQKPNCLQELSVPTPITSFRKLLRALKMESPDFAIYRNFRRLRLKNNPNAKDMASTDNKKDIKPKRKSGRKRGNFKSNAIEDHKTEICNTNRYTMWTEKYKPLAAEDIVGNGRSVEQLKKWLETWKRCNDEMLRKDKGERKRKDSSSGDEFMNFDDSNDSISGNLPNNTAILVGPHGCGKTAAVYAIANELGCKVLEINASSKRNGKRMLSELQEATQSHQVRAGTDQASIGVLNSFLNGENKKPKKKKTKTNKVPEPKQNGNDDNGSSKMSIILVEGADVVYEDQDEGFISALNTLVASSKRPVILVANDHQCPHLLRFMDSKLVLKFAAPSSKAMSVWLQLICLLEGLRVNRAEIERLLDKNLADVRQTMLQLQFWILSGGSNLPMYRENNVPVSPEKRVIPQTSVEDEQSNLSWASNEETDDTALSIPEFSHCIETFTEYDQQFINNQQLPFPMDLSAIWWNLTSLLSLPENLYQGRIDSQSQSTDEATLKGYDGILDETDDELTNKEVEDSVVKTVTNASGKAQFGCDDDRESDTVSLPSTKETDISETVNKSCLKEKEDSGIVSDGTESNGSAKEGSMSQSSEVQSTNKNACTQLEIDSVFRLLERMSTIDIISTGTDVNCVTYREPCLRSWDNVPQDGMSLSESEHCQWWENSVSRVLCHRLVEGSVHTCRTQLQEARNCSESVMESKITYCRPTQSELRWRSSQHAANNALLPGVALWNRIDHHSVCSDYFPMLRAVTRCEKERLTCNTKRRNRFFHYLKGLNIHVGDTTLETLCATFDNKIVA